jgi:hypothetical protein
MPDESPKEAAERAWTDANSAAVSVTPPPDVSLQPVVMPPTIDLAEYGAVTLTPEAAEARRAAARKAMDDAIAAAKESKPGGYIPIHPEGGRTFVVRSKPEPVDNLHRGQAIAMALDHCGKASNPRMVVAAAWYFGRFLTSGLPEN